MKKLLAATAIILSIAAPALAQMAPNNSSIHGSRDRGSSSESMQSSGDVSRYDANTQIDNTTTQSIAPSGGSYVGSAYDLSARPFADTSETGNQAVGGRAN